jgi:hypothetical protein
VLPKVLSNQALLMTARAFAHDAEPIADRFIAHVMPKTFLADLEAAIGRFPGIRDWRCSAGWGLTRTQVICQEARA